MVQLCPGEALLSAAGKINLPSNLPVLLILKVSLAMVFSIMDICPVRIAGRPIKFT